MANELKLRVSKLTPSENRFTTVQELLNLIPNNVQIYGGESGTTVNFGHETPSIEAQGSPWIRFSQTGDYLGFYIFIQGQWSLAPSHLYGQLVPINGLDASDIPAGYEIANGNNETADMSAQFNPPWEGTDTVYSVGWLQWKGLTK